MSSVDPQCGFYLKTFFFRVKGKSCFPFPCVDNPRPHLYPYFTRTVNWISIIIITIKRKKGKGFPKYTPTLKLTKSDFHHSLLEKWRCKLEDKLDSIICYRGKEIQVRFRRQDSIRHIVCRESRECHLTSIIVRRSRRTMELLPKNSKFIARRS